MRCPVPVDQVKDILRMEWGILPGYDLTADYPELGECLLVCVTEMNTRQEIDDLVEALAEVAEMAGRAGAGAGGGRMIEQTVYQLSSPWPARPAAARAGRAHGAAAGRRLPPERVALT